MNPPTLPPTLFNFATHNEDAAVEMLLIDELGANASQPLRVLMVAGCGTHAVAMCASPDVGHIDAVDVSPGQLHLAALIRAGFEALESPEELALFIGNSGDAAQRAALYPKVREHTGPSAGAFWDKNLATVEAGVIACGGAERCQTVMRANLPTDDFVALSKDPEAVLAALRAGMTLEMIQENIVGMPLIAMQGLAEHGVPMIAAQASQRLLECAGKTPDFTLEFILHGRFPMDPVEARPVFLRPETFGAVRQNGCGPDRLAFHEGPVQVVGPELARTGGSYDLVDVSNILDMAPPDVAPAIVAELAKAARPGGTIVCRGHKAPGTVAELFDACGLQVNAALSSKALALESSFFMSDVCVATTPSA
jgi:S-adenosylmethionine:diacylglycerol 3-amino-3-carboxypropyl transferase